MGDTVPTFVPGFHTNPLKMNKMNYNILGSTNLLVSKLSLGTGGFSYFYGDYSLEECKKVVVEAVKSGINYIDTGPWYGHGESETILGKCLREIPRKAYYIATKVGRYEADPNLMFDFSARKTRLSINESLNRLGVDYFDIVQVHDVEFASSLDIIVNETLPCLQELVEEGKIGFIGITGYSNAVLKELVTKSKININTVLSYTRMTMVDRNLEEYIPFYKSKNMGIINAAVHGMGLLTNAGPQSWHPASESLKKKCAELGNFCRANGVEMGKLALYHALQENGPDTTLCGVNNTHLLNMNLDVLFEGLTAKEMEIYDEVVRRFRGLDENHWEGVEVDRFKKNDFSFAN